MRADDVPQGDSFAFVSGSRAAEMTAKAITLDSSQCNGSRDTSEIGGRDGSEPWTGLQATSMTLSRCDGISRATLSHRDLWTGLAPSNRPEAAGAVLSALQV